MGSVATSQASRATSQITGVLFGCASIILRLLSGVKRFSEKKRIFCFAQERAAL